MAIANEDFGTPQTVNTDSSEKGMLTSPGQQAQRNVSHETILDSDESLKEKAPETPGAQHEGPTGRRPATNRRGRSRVPAPAGVTHVATDMRNMPPAVTVHSQTATGPVTGFLRSAGSTGAAQVAIGPVTDTLRSAGSTGAAQGAQVAPGHPSTGLNTSSGPPSFAGKPVGYQRETSQHEPTRTKRSASDSRRVTGQTDQSNDSVEQAAPKVRVRRLSPQRDSQSSHTALVSVVGTDTLYQTIARPTDTAQGKAPQTYRPYTGGVYHYCSQGTPGRHTTSGLSRSVRESTS